MSEPEPPTPDRTRTAARTGPFGAGPVALPPRWRVERPLGVGGQSEVWLAYDCRLQRLVAVKTFAPDLSPTARERLGREVRLGQTLRHPNLVKVYELIEAGDRLCFAMEWMEGGSLAHRVAEGGLAVEAVIAAAEQTLAALAYLHAQHIVHRDVKPSNLLLDAAGRVHLADLGLVRPLEPGETLTRTDTTVGTPAFMSPEQIHNEPVTAATDLYGLGASLYQLLTGEFPFAGDSDLEIAVQHVVAPIPDPRRVRPDCPRWLSLFVRRLLEKSPRDRWPDAATAARAFALPRLRLPPRVLRRAAVAACVAVAAGASALWGVRAAERWSAAAITASVETDGVQVRGLDGRGRVAWSYALAAGVRQVERADLDGDGRKQTVVTAFPVSSARVAGEPQSEVVIVNADGTLRSRVRPEELVRHWPYGCRKLLNPFVKILDVPGDRRQMVLLLGHSRDSFPTAVLAYQPARGQWTCAFSHSGYVMDVIPVAAGPVLRLRVLAFNNRMGMVHAVGEVALSLAGGGATPFPGVPQSPDIGGIGPGGGDGWRWYTLTEQPGTVATAAGLAAAPDGTTSFRLGTSRVAVDRSGSPCPGPNCGRDLSALRRLFLDRLVALDFPGETQTRAGVRALAAEVARELTPLLAERPYRATLAVHVAAALTRLGDPSGAAEVLLAAARDAPCEDVEYRLATVEALSGRLDTARALASGLCVSGITPAGNSRAHHLLIGLLVELHDADAFAQAVARDSRPFSVQPSAAEGLATALWARARLWWGELGETDLSVRSWDFSPEGGAVACLARWRMGRTVPGDIEEMSAFARDNPDVAPAGEVARAAAELALGRSEAALGDLERAVPALEARLQDLDTVDPYLLRQFLDLARALRVPALSAAHRRREAREEARRLRPTLRAGLLPAAVVAETLAASGQGAQR